MEEHQAEPAGKDGYYLNQSLLNSKYKIRQGQTIMTSEEVLSECRDALERIQAFDPAELGREEDLGRHMNFVDAIDPAKAIIDIYKRIPVSALSDFTDSQLQTIMKQANADFNTFKQIREFSPVSSDAANTRSTIINNVKGRRNQLFEQLWQFIAYGVARVTDTSLLEAQARATIQGIEDKAEKLTGHLNQAKTDADEALAAIRAVASEQGVSQQASYFQNEAQNQDRLAATWLSYTYWFAGILITFAVVSLFLHKLAWIKPDGTNEMLQLITSKILIFAVLGYMLVMAARNYTTHKHNAVVNRHRQNALLTYRAIVTAAEDSGTQDIVLAHAASCIFSPQETGFSQGKGGSEPGSRSVMELLTRGVSKSG